MSRMSSEASWNLFSPLMTEYSSIVNLISLVCLGLGLMLFVPVILLVIFDFVLWMWRNICNENPPPTDEPDTVNLDQISGDSHGGHITSSARTLDDQGVASVSLGIEADNANLDLLGGSIDASNESDNLAGLLSSSLGLLHLRVKGRELLKEFVAAGNRLELLGDKALHGERGGRLNGDASQTSKNGQLTGNVETVEVISGIRLGVTQRLGLLDLLRPLTSLALSRSKGVEEERHGAAENTLDLSNLVASLNEILQGGDDGKTSTDG
ncbi:hypothetical protein HG531_008621 [Fusarium graminearum]|nr:hypothetical protein HG531_008621 [Fusarium graminearum]